LIFSCFSRGVSTDTPDIPPDQITTLQVHGMTYAVIQGQVVNITKDSLEVRIRIRNEKYLELANRQLK